VQYKPVRDDARAAREGQGICLIDTANTGDISLGQSILDLKLLTVMCVPLRVKTS